MFTIIFIMFSGMLAGYLLRRLLFGRLGRVITALIWMLLFLLGLEVGSNERIVSGLATLGLEALLITLAGTLGSVMAAWGLWRYTHHGSAAVQFTLDKGESTGADTLEAGGPAGPYLSGEIATDTEGTAAAVDVAAAEEVAAEGKDSLWKALKGSLVIVSFFVLGVLIALSRWITVSEQVSNFSFYALAGLMACVGASIGSDPQTLRNFRALNPRLVLLPIGTIFGTLAATVVVSPLLSERSLTDCLAVGSGFAYYSLSSIFITEYRGAELGTIALLSNICRELLTLLAAPLLVRWFGRLAPIAAGGATTMYTTLPVIARTSGSDLVVVSLFHGFVVDFSVPFLVTFWCSV